MATNSDLVMAIRRGLVYEGEVNFLRAIHPVPIVSFAKFEHSKPIDRDALALDGMVFREDSFDPVTRIRRGRFYARCDNQIRTIPVANVHNYPFGNHIGIKGLEWEPDGWYRPLTEGDIHQRVRVCIIGNHDFQTTWRVIDVEHVFTGELLWTLKAKSTMGILPELKERLDRVDHDHLVDSANITAAIEKLVDASRIQQAEPVIEVARETTRVILATWLGPDAKGKDLGAVIKAVPDDKYMVGWAASIISRLHPRVKSAEQEKQKKQEKLLREISGEDAEISVHLIGFLLREINWAKA
jgi:hypothetical protein